MLTKRLLPAVAVLSMMGALLLAKVGDATNSGAGMIDSAQKFLGSLSEEQKKQATFSYDDPERLNWHFIPRERKGLPLKALEGAPLKLAHQLIQSGLSPDGYDQTINIMSLEEILFLLEGGDREVRREKRDPRKYFLTVFGEPSATGVWGWRLEGHHISLNYTVKDGKVVSSTPEFFGANPGLVDAGPKRAIRVLGSEEDLARQILLLCNEEQKKVAWRSTNAPDDLRGGGVAQPETTAAVGLPVSKMTGDQKKLMQDLLQEYLKNMPGDVEKERRARINDAGMDKIMFSWWGSEEPNKRHYYRVQGPTFLIEYNNTQNDANHVHSMWRNLGGDFNVPIK